LAQRQGGVDGTGAGGGHARHGAAAEAAARGKPWSDSEEEAFKQPIRKQFEEFQSIYNFASNLWIDDVVDPVETRAVLGLALDLAARQPPRETRFGVFRM
jgi:3-methylcrotonyl-CoA carboxylase beta subunit